MFCFQGITDSEVQNAELPVPKNCLQTLYMMKICWNPEKRKRPTFQILKRKLRVFLYLHVDNNDYY